MRPKNKEDLLNLSRTNYQTLIDLIESIPTDVQEQEFPFEDRDRNIRDVLIHLYEWHQLALTWAEANLAGKEHSFLPAPYNWKTYPQMNIELWKSHQNTSLDTSKSSLAKSHQQIMSLIDQFTNEELFTKKYFSWTGSTHLASYLISATSSHYEWAIKKIKRFKKTVN